MNRFDPSTPRTACGIAAIAMTAITIGVMVVMPTRMESGSPDVFALTAAKSATPTATEVVISPACIDVAGVRDPNVAVQAGSDASKRKQRS